MFKVKVNETKERVIDFNPARPEQTFAWDLVEVRRGSFHIIKDSKSYVAEVLSADPAEKNFVIRVNGNTYHVHVKDRFDDLLHELGMDRAGTGKGADMKAPMPGLVVDVRVQEGTEVKKGDPVLVLEAMKMENILKAPGDGRVKKIAVKKGMAVEKNQVLVSIE